MTEMRFLRLMKTCILLYLFGFVASLFCMFMGSRDFQINLWFNGLFVGGLLVHIVEMRRFRNMNAIIVTGNRLLDTLLEMTNKMAKHDKERIRTEELDKTKQETTTGN